MAVFEVILQDDISSVGNMGDIVKVRAGYARNYLFPRRLAVISDPESLKRVEKLRTRRAAVEAAKLEEMREFAGRLSATEVSIEAAAGEAGQLYGSVGAREIVTALASKGITVEERDVRLEHPLKEIGVFPVKIHLHGELSAEIKVWVVESKKPE